MSGEKRTVPMPGGAKPGVQVDVKQAEEGFNSYLLDDGNTIRLKTVLMDVVKLDDLKDELGSPIYFLQHRVVVSVVLGTKKAEA